MDKILPPPLNLAIGLMSGTSLDGVDAALIATDGLDLVELGPGLCVPYAPDFRNDLRRYLGQEALPSQLLQNFHDVHERAVVDLLALCGLLPKDITVVGFHGQTLLHQPAQKTSIQAGDGGTLAKMLGIRVVSQFRQADVAAGGQGAPLVPIYHQALLRSVSKPAAVLNIGGVANITFIDQDGSLLAFDTGPGGALLDDWMQAQLSLPFDPGGQLALQGRVQQALIDQWLAQPFFALPPPKSLDRDAFRHIDLSRLSDADGAATLVAFTAQAVYRGLSFLPKMPLKIYVAGGGRKNNAMMLALAQILPCPVAVIEALPADGDLLEAQAFAYLAMRSLLKLPLSFPGTTGVPAPQTGGVLHDP